MDGYGKTEEPAVLMTRRIRKTLGRSSSLKYMPGDTELVFRPLTEKTDAERDFIRGSLCANPNLPRMCPLNAQQIDMLVDIAYKDVIEVGDTIMCEGDIDSATFFFVASGECQIDAECQFKVVHKGSYSYLTRPELNTEFLDDGSVTVSVSKSLWFRQTSPEDRTKIVEKVGQGCSFGDSSLLFGVPRWCTVTALQQCVVWCINQNNFKIVQNMHADSALSKRSTQKSPEDELLIAEVLRTNANIQRLAPLNEAHISTLVKLAWQEDVPKDNMHSHEGDLNADAFFIVASGSLQFTGSDGSEPVDVVQCGEVSHFSTQILGHSRSGARAEAQQPIVKTLGRGHCWGEISMLYCAPRFLSVKALEDTKMWGIDRAQFQLVLIQAAEEELRMRVKHLDNLNINILNTLNVADKEKFAGIMEKLRLTKDEKLHSQGELCNGVYILCEGAVKSISADGKEQYFEANPSEKSVHYFGQGAIVSDAPCDHTVVVTSQTSTCLVLGRDEFRDMCDRLLDNAMGPAFERYTTSVSKVAGKQEHVLREMKTIGPLGCSIFGPINLVKDLSTGGFFAKKDLNKGRLVQRGLRKGVVRERTLWIEMTCPFVARLIRTYNEPQTVSYLLEAALGGELGWCYEKNNLYGSETHTRYYLAGIVIALEYLHKMQVIYRNIKPQNILLSQDGQPKLTDMSLAKRVIGQTYTTCGTPVYMAPEIIRGSGHNRAVDWWTMGVLAFELMSGRCPFESEHPMQIYSNVMRGISRASFPATCTPPLVALITSLCHSEDIDRLPMRQGGIQNIIGHEWFSGFDWAGMREARLEPPFKPSQAGMEDEKLLANFEPRMAKMKKPVPYTHPAPTDTDDLAPLWDTPFGVDEEDSD